MINRLFKTIKIIYPNLTFRKKFQFYLLIFLSLLNGIFESISIGFVLIYTNIILFPNKVLSYLENFEKIINLEEILNKDNFIFLVTLSFMIIIVTSTVFKIFFIYFQAKFANSLYYDLSNVFFKNLLKKKYKFFVDTNINEILANFDKLNTILSIILGSLIMISSFIVFILIILTMSMINFELILITTLLLLIYYFIISKIVSKITNKVSYIENSFVGKAFNQISLITKNFKEIILYDKKNYLNKKFSKLIYNISKYRIYANMISETPKNILLPLIMISLLIFIFYFSQSNDLNLILPELAALIFASQRIIPLVNNMYGSSVKIVTNFHITENVFNQINKENMFSEKNTQDNEFKIKKKNLIFSNSIEIKNLNYTFDSQKKIISNLNLKINKGEKISITGRNGSGKTTLINILMGFYDDYQGEIIIDGNKLDKNNLRDWQSNISYVPQNLFLFDDTIRNNIIFNENYDSDNFLKFKKSVTLAKVDDFVKNLDESYNTIVNDGGSRFSGGQIQRISIARAIYNSKEILILDEFTSQIDKHAELDIVRNLFSNFKDKTIIIITHNKEIMNLCREINLE